MNDWRTVPLEDLRAPGDYTLVGGPFGSDLTTADYVERPGVPVIRGTNLDGKDCNFLDDGFVYVSSDKAADLSRNLAYPGDVIFTQRGTLGQVAQIPAKARFSRYVISQSQMKLTVDLSKACPRFIYHYYRSDRARSYLERNTLATGVPHINLSILKQLPVPLPPLEEQRRIAAVLDKADAIRRKRQEAIALTEQLIRSTFLEMFGDPAINPKGWPVVDMADLIAETQYGTAQKANEAGLGLPVLRMNNLTYQGSLDLRDLKWCEVAPKDRPAYTVKRGDLLFNRTNSPELVGKTAVWVLDDEYAYAGYLVRVRFQPERAHPHYISAFLNSEHGKRLLAGMAKASSNMSNISASDIRRIRLPLPILEVQQRFANVVETLLIARRAHEFAAVQADALFHSLTHRAFTGQL